MSTAASEDEGMEPAPGDEDRRLRERLAECVHHLEHILPAQAPIRDFVHHNTLHGFQHLPFQEALAEAFAVTGIRGYLPPEAFRALYQQGRIAREDLESVLAGEADLEPAAVLLDTPAGPVRKQDALLVALTRAISPISPARLRWRAAETDMLQRFGRDVASGARQRLLAAARAGALEGEEPAVADLWAACLEVLGLSQETRHAEEWIELPSPPEIEDPCAPAAEAFAPRALGLWIGLVDRLGWDWTLRGLLKALTGADLLDAVRPSLIRQLGAHLDQGLAAWHNPARSRGFYAAWRLAARDDPAWSLIDLPGARREIDALPEAPVEAVMGEFRRMGLPEDRWSAYLERLALELPGWSGMFLWRSLHPGYGGSAGLPVDMMGYLAVRLVLERLHADALALRLWGVPASLSALQSHFGRHAAELYVRHACHAEDLPEYLANLIECQVAQPREAIGGEDPGAWKRLARRLADWLDSPERERPGRHGVGRTAWPLFRLCQHLGIAGGPLRGLGAKGAARLLACLELDADRAGFIWLRAYERHYRERIFAALAANHGRWPGHAGVPSAQLVFCMDDREEGTRRHLEEIDPSIETLGAAAHFNVFQNWRGLDDEGVTPLCPVVPVVVRPAHEVREVPRPEAAAVAAMHRQRHAARMRWKELLHQGTRRSLLTGPLLTVAAAPLALGALLARTLAPAGQGRLVARLRVAHDGVVPTRLALTAPPDSPPATPDDPRLGFTDTEQADRVQGFLRTIGLASNLAPLVVIMGHGSDSRNNPHLAAYDCGACAGRHSGPNARLLAAMANRPGVRALLAERGMAIPAGTWFLGAEHNTCDDGIAWYDVEDLPEGLRAAFARLDGALAKASAAHARERCRRFASAPDSLAEAHAWRHVMARGQDISQARPELGHATNATAFIGRRAMSRGAFFDRRAFLISYDPAQDPEGAVLERLLLANGPVGAGISLEYYFSTVNNERFGCGTKIVHNVTGLFGVMEGAGSDLRTGLPRQMIEIHEAMRLLVVVEHRIEVITAIYQRQPPLRELIGNGWVVVAAKDPDSPAIHLFDPARGWLRWEGGAVPPTVATSADWLGGEREPLPPALLTRPLEGAR